MKRWLVLALLVGCKSNEGAPTGVGSYVFGHTTLGSIHDGNCAPTDLSDGRKATWCRFMPPIKVGSKVADINAYFLGTDANAPMIELQLQVRGCIEDETDRWMRARFGPPYLTKSTREYWKNAFIWVMAELPSEPARCNLHFLPISEAAEIARLEAK